MTVLPSNPEQWVDLHGDSLYHYTLKFIRQPDEAQNLVQETFLAALKNRDSFRGQSSEKTWLISILKHKITDHLRRKYRETPVSQLAPEDGHVEQFFDAASGHLKKEPAAWEFNPAALLNNKEFWEVLNSCLDALPEKAGQAFSLREIDRLPSEEICKVLGISTTNLWVLLHRARIQLRQCLEMKWYKG